MADPSFDGVARLITLNPGTTAVDVLQDIYSGWKRWVQVGDNSKFLPAFSIVGGNDIDPTAGTKIPGYAFLTNGWRIKPDEADHNLAVVGGVILVDGGGDPFISTNGAYTVRVNYQQPVQAITVESEVAAPGPTAPENAAAVWAEVLENGLSAAEVQRLMLAVLVNAGVVPAGPGSFVFRDSADTKNRVEGTISSSGTRDVTSVDGS